jgi:hypothetical protein
VLGWRAFPFYRRALLFLLSLRREIKKEEENPEHQADWQNYFTHSEPPRLRRPLTE